MAEPGTDIEAVEPRGALVASSSILSDDEITRVFRIAKALAASSMFKDVTQAEQAFGRILLGRDLGLSPTQSLMSIDVVRGNVQLRSTLLAGWVRKHPDYDYTVVEHDAEHCAVDFYYKGELAGRSEFSIEDAKAAGIYSTNGPWKAHPRNMVWARAMSNGVKWFCPDLTGGIPVYTEADTFEDRRELGAGEGDGSEPGWEQTGLTPDQIFLVEGVIAEADAIGFAALGAEARGPIQMKLHSQPPGYVEQWLAWAQRELEAARKVPPADVPDAEVVPEGGETA